MTEGGGTCILEAHTHPDKLHTVGRPAEGHDIRLIDDEGREVAPGEAGEVVGHSPTMMTGYRNQPEQTREAEWYAPDGKRFIRTGDIGCFDADGFLTLIDRKKDMIISGGFNIYQATSRRSCATSAVRMPPSSGCHRRSGANPGGFVVRCGKTVVPTAAQLAELQVGKTQRLPICVRRRAASQRIGKVLKRQLRDRYVPTPQKRSPMG
jgi:hypothetical protein